MARFDVETIGGIEHLSSLGAKNALLPESATCEKRTGFQRSLSTTPPIRFALDQLRQFDVEIHVIREIRLIRKEDHP